MIFDRITGATNAIDNRLQNSVKTGFDVSLKNIVYLKNLKKVFGENFFNITRVPLYPVFVGSQKRKVLNFSVFQAKNRTPDVWPFFGSRNTDIDSSLLADLLLMPVEPIKKYYGLSKLPAFVYNDGNVSKILPMIGIRSNDFVSPESNPDFVGLKIDSEVKDFGAIYLDFSQSPLTITSGLWIFEDDFDALDNWSVKSGEANVDGSVLTLNDALIATNTQVFHSAGFLNFKEFSDFTICGLVIELDVLDIPSGLSIGYGKNDSGYTERVYLGFNPSGRLNFIYYTDRQSLIQRNYLNYNVFKTKDGKYKLFIALYYLGKYEQKSQSSYTYYYYGAIRAIVSPFVRYLPFFFFHEIGSYLQYPPPEYQNYPIVPYDLFLYTSSLVNYKKTSYWGTSSYYANYLFNSDDDLYLFLEGTAKIDRIRIRPIVEINRYPYHEKLFNKVSAFSEGEPSPQAIAETQETYSRSNKSFAFVQETSKPIPEIPAGKEPPKEVSVKNGKKFIRSFKTSLFVVQPLPYKQQRFRYTQNEFTITVTKKGRDSIQLEYEVPLGRFVRVVFPCNMIFGELPANLKINRNMVEGWIIYDEDISFTVTDEDSCVYNVTLKPVNYLERT